MEGKCMETRRFAVNEYVTSEEIKNARKKLGLTQKEFAQLIGSSKPTVERWERENTQIKGPIILLLQMLLHDPDYALQFEIPARKLPVRMWYMYKNKVCTLIDVDEVKQIVQIKNYADNIMFRAFGSNQKPDIEDYREFLESRCFPRTRDKMKLVLKDLGIPFYDPYLIIQKTEGRMSEDDFWIRIEK